MDFKRNQESKGVGWILLALLVVNRMATAQPAEAEFEHVMEEPGCKFCMLQCVTQCLLKVAIILDQQYNNDYTSHSE